MDTSGGWAGIRMTQAESAAFERSGIVAADLLTMTAEQVSRATSLSVVSIERLTEALTRAVEAQLVHDRNGADMVAAPHDFTRYMTTGDAHMDEMLGGGFPTRRISEVCGESGAGKSQFMAQLCVTVQLPPSLGGLDADAVYISTEHGLAVDRVQEMADATLHRYRDFYGSSEASTAPPKQVLPKKPLDHVQLVTCPDLELQDHMLYYQLPALLEQRNNRMPARSYPAGRPPLRHQKHASTRPIGVVIIDSIAANYRAEYEQRRAPNGGSGKLQVQGLTTSGKKNDLAGRTRDLVRLGSHLRELAKNYDIAVIVTNQVSDRIIEDRPSPYGQPPGPYTMQAQRDRYEPGRPSSQPARPSSQPAQAGSRSGSRPGTGASQGAPAPEGDNGEDDEYPFDEGNSALSEELELAAALPEGGDKPAGRSGVSTPGPTSRPASTQPAAKAVTWAASTPAAAKESIETAAESTETTPPTKTAEAERTPSTSPNDAGEEARNEVPMRIERDDSALDYDLRYDVQVPYLSTYTGNDHRDGGGVATAGFKVPSLGLVWTNLIDIRIAVRRISPRLTGTSDEGVDESGTEDEARDRKRRKVDTKEYQAMLGWLVSWSPPWLKTTRSAADTNSNAGAKSAAQDNVQRVPLREMCLVFAPHKPPAKLNYVVVKQGVFGMP